MADDKQDETKGKRIFVYEGREFPDEDPKLAPDDVRQQMAAFFPELANADFATEKRADGVEVITFRRKVGTKGYTVSEPVDAKTTPSQCKFLACHYNRLPPAENSQECIACEGLVHPRLFRKAEVKR